MRATLNRLVQLGAQQVEIALPDLDMSQVGVRGLWHNLTALRLSA
jgi:hypothetical protein